MKKISKEIEAVLGVAAGEISGATKTEKGSGLMRVLDNLELTNRLLLVENRTTKPIKSGDMMGAFGDGFAWEAAELVNMEIGPDGKLTLIVNTRY